VNFRDRYGLKRPVSLRIKALPEALRGGTWQQWLIDATHSNVWNEQGKAELAKVKSDVIEGEQFSFEQVLSANSVTLIEILKK
jgi:hypothetical protein